MQSLLEFISGFIVMLVAAALAHFGGDLRVSQRPSEPRVQRTDKVSDCDRKPASLPVRIA